MNPRSTLLALVLSLSGGSRLAAAAPTDPCAHSDGWRAALCDFAKTHLVHPAWGYEHSLRDYTLAMALARQESVAVDEEVIFAAAMLHDMGGFPPYARPGIDHAVRSTQVADAVLGPAGFPREKGAAVKAAILNHSYYDHTVPATAEGIALHDADGLDFLGGVAVMRILGIVGKEAVTPDTASALKLLHGLCELVPLTIYGGKPTQALLRQRRGELLQILTSIQNEAYDFGIPRKP